MSEGHSTHETESPWPLHFNHSHWWNRRNRSKFASHYAWGTDGVCECKMYVKPTWIPTWHRMDHVSWSLGLFSKNHLLEVGLTQNQEIIALWTLTTVGLFYFITCEDPCEHKSIEIAFGWGPGHIRLHSTLEDPWPHSWLWRCVGMAVGHFLFGLSQSHGHGSWLVCEVALSEWVWSVKNERGGCALPHSTPKLH